MDSDPKPRQPKPSRLLWERTKLEPEVRAAIRRQVEWELARRSLSGALVYFIMSVVVALSTPFYREHPAIVLATGCIMLVTGLLRIVTARRLMREPAAEIPRTSSVFIASIVATFVVWGAFCGCGLYLYAGQWTAMFLLLTTAALAGGASSSLAPNIRLAYSCIIVLIVPTIVTSLFVGDTRHWAIAVGGSLYLGFLVAQAVENRRAFWTASVAAERERIRGSEERKRAEMERASLVAAIEQAAEQILITDVHGDIQYCNPAFESVTGYSRSEVIGKNPRFLNSGKHDQEYYRSLWKTILSGGVWTGRLTNRRKDGTLYEEDGTISPIYDTAGQLTGFVSAAHDVTERLRMESDLRQAQKMESIGRLAGAIAHDFNNLLTVISGYSLLLKDELEESDHRQQYVQEIGKSAERAASLTRQLLTFSRKQIIIPKPVDLNTLTADMRGMLQRLVGEDVQVVTLPAPSLGLVRVDPDQMSQILLNLAANARDAMPKGGQLTIRTANVDDDRSGTASTSKPLQGPAVLLSVSDTGAGMDEETRQQIFEPFFTTKERGRGTGLGLSTVYGIVQQSEGCIDVQTELGAGTTFRIYLPRIDGQIAQVEGTANSVLSVSGSETVLVVEDQDDVRRLIAGVLESHGFRVLEAPNGRAALLQSQHYAGPIELLLTDVIMPDMTGKEVADQLMPQRPGMKVLYTSGYSGELIAHRGVLDAGVAYLPKPFTPSALAAKVREVLGPGAGGRTV